MRDDPELLDLMMTDQADQPPVYQPGPYWIGNQRRCVEAIRRLGVGRFRSEPAIGKGYADTRLVDPADTWVIDSFKAHVKRVLAGLPLIRKLLSEYVAVTRGYADEANRLSSYYYQERFGDWLAKNVRAETMPETMHGGCERFITYRGQRYAQLYIDQAIRIDNFARHVAFDKVRVFFELGGGFGATTHLMIKKYESIRKVAYVDIPPMLYVATQYLKNFYGDAVRDYRETRRLDRIEFRNDDTLEIICLCPWQVERLQITADIFWNAASLSEMTPSIVQNYARHVIRNLSQNDGTLCLVLNKGDPSPLTTTPDQVKSAFGDAFVFQPMVPEIEHERHPAYFIGCGHANMSSTPDQAKRS